MFDTEIELTELLNCPNCKNEYDEPKILPCGKIVCTECIAIILYRINKTSKIFKCLICTDYHNLPKGNQFPICEQLVTLMKKRPTEVLTNRCSLNDTLKMNLKDIKEKMTQLKKNTFNGTDKIKNHFGELKNDVLIRAEVIIAEVNKLNENLIKQIDLCESECIQNFEKEIDFKKALNKDLIEINKFHTQYTDCLQSGSLKTKLKMLENANLIAETMKTRLDSKSCELEMVLFNNSKITFSNHPQLSQKDKIILSDLIGYLKTTKNPATKHFNIKTDLKRLALKNPFIDYTVNHIEYINDSTVFIALCCENKPLRYTVLDIQKNSVAAEFYEENTDLSLSNVLITSSSKDKEARLIVNVVDFVKNCNYLRLFDAMTLEIKHRVKIFDYALIGLDMNVYDGNIYCISKTSSSSHLRIYNWKLEFVNSIGQSKDCAKKYYFPCDVKQLVQSNKKYYLLSSDSFLIIDEQNGNLIQSMEIKADEFILNKNDLVFLLSASSKIQYFDLELKFSYEIELQNLTNDILTMKSFSCFHYFDKIEFNLYQ